MPSISDFVYAALLYKDDAAPANPPHKDFASGREAENGKLIFLFQRPDEKSGLTLEIFAFKADTTTFFKESAIFSGKKSGLSVAGEAIEINDPHRAHRVQPVRSARNCPLENTSSQRMLA